MKMHKVQGKESFDIIDSRFHPIFKETLNSRTH